MTINSDNKTSVNEEPAYAILQEDDRPTKSKLVSLFRKLKRQGVIEQQDNYKPQVDNKNAISTEHTINDDFICFLKSDNSSVASSGGISVVATKLDKVEKD